jgi:hypothetical protein
MSASLPVATTGRSAVQRAFAAIERLATRLAWEVGTLDERVTSLPAPAAMGALSDLYEAGWVYASE